MAANTKNTWWQRYLAFPLIWKFAIALVAGGVVGVIVGPSTAVLQPLGDLFLRLLQMLVVPLILVTLVAGASSISPARLGRVGGKIFIYYMVTSAVAVTLGVVLALAVNPGTGLDMPSHGAHKPAQAPSITETLLGIVPENPFQAMVHGKVLPVIFCAVLVGLALGWMRHSDNERLRELGDLARRLTDAAVEIMFLVVRGVLEYGPIGVFALLAVVLGKTGASALAPLAKLTSVVYGGVGLQIALYCALLLIFRISLRRFFGAARDPMMTAYVTRSSSGTLPVTMRAAEKLGISESIYGFSLPLGATINMDGTGLYIGAATVFVANVVGVHLTLGQLAGIVLVGVLASIGTAGVPSAGLIMLTMTITQAGLPLAPVALVAGIDAVLDMIRCVANVTGDLTGTRIVAKSEPDLMRQPDASTRTVPVAGTPGVTV